MSASILYEKAFLTEEIKTVTKTRQMDEQGKAGNGREIWMTNNGSRVVDQPWDYGKKSVLCFLLRNQKVHQNNIKS